jgi:hypothetical protein
MNLPHIRQIQIIADTLNTATLPPNVEPDQLTGRWTDYYYFCEGWLAQREPDPQRLQFDFQQRFGGFSSDKDNANLKLIEDQMAKGIHYPPAKTTLADFPDLRWLWKSWLLQGLPSLLAAAPGTGKSYLALDLAHRVIANRGYPDGTPITQPGPVLFVDAENTPAIHKERLSTWDPAHLSQLYFMFPDEHRFLINLDDYADRERLSDMAWTIRPALIIIDSYGACTLKGENNKEDVQALLSYFTHLAKHFDCALLIIHHLRKAAGGQTSFVPMTIANVRGSSHIVAMARHIWGLQFVPTGPEDDLKSPRRLWIIKSNVGAPPAPIGVQFNPHPANAEIAQLTYGAAPKPFKEPTKLDECADWLLSTLLELGQPVKPSELVALGKDAGYRRSTIYRAHKALGDLVTDSHPSTHPKNTWSATDDPE